MEALNSHVQHIGSWELEKSWENKTRKVTEKNVNDLAN